MKYRTPRSEASNAPRERAVDVSGASPHRVALVLGVLCVVTFFVCAFIGSHSWTIGEVWRSFLSESETRLFEDWRHLRAKRVLFAGTVGALLSLSGLVFQAVLRNPLAEPYVLGVSGGASLATVIGVIIGIDLASMIGGVSVLVLFAFTGAIASMLLLMLLARIGDLRQTATLILCGVVLNAVFLAAILLFFSLARDVDVVTSLPWLIGDLGTQPLVPSSALLRNTVAIVIGGVGFWAVARHLDLLSLSDDEASDLGLRPERFRWGALLAASTLTAVAVAGVGPVGFVGLIVPHTVKLWIGPSHRRNIPATVLGGAMFLMVADTVARAAHTSPIPVGSVTALCGGPFFLFLLVRGRREVRT